MELLLLRHGKAEDTHAEGDFARELVEKGVRQSTRAGRLLKALDRRPDVVLTSPRVRARQTAGHFCEAAGMPGPVVQPWIDCGMGPEEALNELQSFSEFGRVMLVGHEPDFSGLVEWLLGDGASVEVKKGSLIGLVVRPPSRDARLLFNVPPKMMAGKREG
ncbi:SixA phosphatase family protein [Haloferula sp. A504]|uniref:SixA phosphatase family protein n=1 Tax=Haloferula sp. A504 TaxID=3373601 RepID=UPI0031BC73F5|nr:histidine phosphatase family protein [Verrucomicrobiaceae bacterium E54]